MSTTSFSTLLCSNTAKTLTLIPWDPSALFIFLQLKYSEGDYLIPRGLCSFHSIASIVTIMHYVPVSKCSSIRQPFTWSNFGIFYYKKLWNLQVLMIRNVSLLHISKSQSYSNLTSGYTQEKKGGNAFWRFNFRHFQSKICIQYCLN